MDIQASKVPFTFTTQLLPKDTKRPERIIYTLKINPSQRVGYVAFRNHYSGVMDLAWKREGEEDFVTSIKYHPLMRDMHHEGDAQDWHCLKVDTNEPLSDITISVAQPSPLWQMFGINNICCFAPVIPPSTSSFSGQSAIFDTLYGMQEYHRVFLTHEEAVENDIAFLNSGKN